jgi:hypothetical protein
MSCKRSRQCGRGSGFISMTHQGIGRSNYDFSCRELRAGVSRI